MLIVGAALPLAFTLPSDALSPGTFVGNDGNLTKEGSTTDWCNKTVAELAAQAAPNTNVCPAGAKAPNLVVQLDKESGSSTDDAFSNGTKDDDDPPTVGTGGVPPNKDDLVRFYVANEKVAGKDFLYLGYERIAPNAASAHEAFEFNQNKCAYGGDPLTVTSDSVCSANGVTPARKAGDALFYYDFEGGSEAPVISVSRWITAGSGDLCEVPSNKKPPCWDKKVALDASKAEALTNSTAVLDPLNPGAPRTMQPNEFGEAAINLTDSNLIPTDSCLGFGSAYVASRSSGNSSQSTRKDFIAPALVNINNCQPATISIKKVDQSGANLGGATIGLYNDEAAAALGHGVWEPTSTLATVSVPGGNTDTTVTNPCVTTAADSTCNWTVTGTGTSHFLIRETAAPAGYNLNTTAVHVDVTFSSSVQNLVQADMVNIPANRDLVVKKIDDDDPANPVSGVVFKVVEDVSPASDFGAAERTAYASATVKTCTTGANGLCTVTDLEPAKFYWVVESSRPAGYGDDTGASSCTVSTGPDVVKRCRRIEVPIGTGSVGPVGATFTNPRLFKVVTIVCRKTDGKLYGSEAAYDGAALTGTNNTATSSTAEAAICAMTGSAVHDNVTYGEHSPNKVNIPR